MTITLPWPPSINHYYRAVGNKVLISKAGRQYRKDVAVLCLNARRFGTERLAVSIELYPPDRRRFDIQNRDKSLLDALEHAGIYEDDGQIDRLTIERKHVERGGLVQVSISAL